MRYSELKGQPDPLLEAEAARSLPVPQLPAQAGFTAFVNDFLYHVFWAAKKLGRGELWTAHECLDGYLKGMLLRLLAWHALARHGTGHNTWHKGRFVEQWADAGAVAAFPEIFAPYDPQAMRHALVATYRLFRRLAQKTAAFGGLVYPISDDDALSALLGSILEGQWNPGVISNA